MMKILIMKGKYSFQGKGKTIEDALLDLHISRSSALSPKLGSMLKVLLFNITAIVNEVLSENEEFIETEDIDDESYEKALLKAVRTYCYENHYKCRVFKN